MSLVLIHSETHVFTRMFSFSLKLSFLFFESNHNYHKMSSNLKVISHQHFVKKVFSVKIRYTQAQFNKSAPLMNAFKQLNV